MRLTIRHKFDFGADRALVGNDLVRPEAWDALRTQTDGPFALPATREEWERVGRRATGDPRPRQGDRRAPDDLGAESLASYGVGGAPLECWLDQPRPGARLIDHRLRARHRRAPRSVFPEPPRCERTTCSPIRRRRRRCTSSIASTPSSPTASGVIVFRRSAAGRCSSWRPRWSTATAAAHRQVARPEATCGRRATRAGVLRQSCRVRGALDADPHRPPGADVHDLWAGSCSRG